MDVPRELDLFLWPECCRRCRLHKASDLYKSRGFRCLIQWQGFMQHTLQATVWAVCLWPADHPICLKQAGTTSGYMATRQEEHDVMGSGLAVIKLLLSSRLQFQLTLPHMNLYSSLEHSLCSLKWPLTISHYC